MGASGRVTKSETYAYSAIAISQITELQHGLDAQLFNRVIDVCESILESPSSHRPESAVITTDHGLRFRTRVPGGYPYKIFWSITNDEARIEAVFRYET